MEPSTSRPPAETPKELDFLRPAISGGLLLGILSCFPVIAAGNCLCCLWIQGGGGLAAWLVNKQRPGTLKFGDGAYAGVLAGLIGTFVYALINIPIQLSHTAADAATALKVLNSLIPDAPPDLQQQMAAYFDPDFNVSRLLMSVIAFSLVGGLFSMIGGILTVAAISQQKKK
jgi:hypothetical protein